MERFVPGYFALVMATGIIGIGAELQNLDAFAAGFWWLSLLVFVVLVVLSLVRVVREPAAMGAELTQHRTGFSYLLVVAALNVLGSGAALTLGAWTFAWVLWIAGLVAGVGLLYPALVGTIVRREKPPLAEGVNGTWFLVAVAPEAIAVLGGLLLAHRGRPSQALELTIVACFALGVVLYLVVMTLMLLRWAFSELRPEDLQPQSWIAAGAGAITTLAGANVLAARGVSASLDHLAPFLEGLMVLAWATATFWIPVLVAVGWWRHVTCRLPLTYQPGYWAIVFPLGMYGVATDRMSDVTDLSVLGRWPPVLLGVALGAWVVTFVAMAASLVRRSDAPA